MKKPAKSPVSTDLARQDPQHEVEIHSATTSLQALAPVGLRALVEEAGVAERSIQRWVNEGLLPAPVVGQHPHGRGRHGTWDGSVRRLCQELAVRRGLGRERAPLWPFRLATWMPVRPTDSVDERGVLARLDAMAVMQFAIEVFILFRERVGPTGGGPRFPAADQQAELLQACVACALAGWPPVLVVGEHRVTVAPAALLGMLLTDGELGGAWVVIDLGWPLAVVGIVGSDASRSREATVGVCRRRDRSRATYEITRDGVAVEVELDQDQGFESDLVYGRPEEDPGR